MKPFITKEDIKRVDTEFMYVVLDNFPNQIREAVRLVKDIKLEVKPQNICICGMGGSAIAADIIKDYLIDIKVPIIVSKSYNLPGFIDKNSLVIISSYSGNTEETLSMYSEAIKRHAKIIAISSGGKVKKIAQESKHDFIRLPKGYQPRNAIAYSLFSLLKLFEIMDLTEGIEKEAESIANALSSEVIKENALKIAARVAFKLPIIYAPTSLSAVAERWKQAINENSKSFAFYNIIPEMEHNEIAGYENAPENVHVIILRNDKDKPKINKKIDIIKKIIKDAGVEVTDINITGNSRLKQIVSAIHIGDWVSFYLAIKYGVDPTAIKAIEKLKEISR